MKRNFKSFFAGTVCAVAGLVMACAGITEVSAAQTAKLEVSSAEGYEGDTVKVTVSLKENGGVSGAVFRLAYDPEVLSVVSAQQADDAVLYKPTVNANGAAFVGYSYADIEDISESGNLLTVEFKIKDNAALGDTALTFSNLDFSNAAENTVEVTPVSGKITVLCQHGTTEERVAPAACTTPGKKTVVCTKCQNVISETEIPATGHIWGDAAVVTDSSCTAAGKGMKTCQTCGAEEEVEIPAKGHSYGDFVITKDPAMETDGECKRECSVCGDAETKSMPALKNYTIKEDMKGKYQAGRKAEFTVKGLDMSTADGNSGALPGDVRFVPVSWTMDGVENTWDNAPYTGIVTTDEIGKYEIGVTYKIEVYETAGWRTLEDTQTVIFEYEVVEETAEADDQGAVTDGVQGGAADDKKEDAATNDKNEKNDNNNKTAANNEQKEGQTAAGNGSVKTGDSSAGVIKGLLAVGIMAGSAVFAGRKKMFR